MVQKDEIWLVMEYCNCSLQELISINKLQENDCAFVTYQMLKAVSYLESLLVIHRDLKSANILLSADSPYIKIGDLGLAVLSTGPRSEVGICGSRYWLAPELLRNEGYGCKVDIWAIGCIMMEMISQRPPYYEFDSVKAMYYTAILGSPPIKLPSSYSSTVLDIFSAIFQTDPGDRCTASELLQHHWFKELKVDNDHYFNDKISTFLQSVNFSRALDDNSFI